MTREEFASALTRLKREHESLVARPNRKTDTTNGVYQRYVYPVVTAEHTPIFWRYDLCYDTNPHLMERIGVNAAFNSGAIELDGKILLALRVEGADRKSFFAIAKSPNGIDSFRFRDYPVVMPETGDPDINVYDIRLVRHEDGWIYGLFCTERKDPDAPKSDTSSATAQCGILRTRDLRHPSENITVTNCTFVSRSSAIRIGGFDQNHMKNYTFSNIVISRSNRGIGIFARDEGSIENLIFSIIVIDTRLHTGDWWGNGEPIHLSAVRLTRDVKLGQIRNVTFQNIMCTGEAGIVAYGTDESVIEDVSFENVSLHIPDSRLNALGGGNFDLRPVLDPNLQLFSHDIPGFFARFVKGLRLRDFDLSWGAVKEPFFTHGVEISDFDGITIENFRGSAAPCAPGASPVFLRNGKGCEIRGEKLRVVKEGVTEP